MINKEKFYAAIRPKLNLTRENVFGTDKLIDYIDVNPMNPNIAAYVFATAWWETGQRMTPVREAYWLTEEWRKKNLRYWPYYGRGLVQTTWEENYRKVAELLGLNPDYFLDNPDGLLEWDYAIPAMFEACKAGLYTGKSFQDYIDETDETDAEDWTEYKHARRVVNGTDKDETIADLGIIFEHALRGAGYTGQSTSAEEALDAALLDRFKVLNQTIQEIYDLTSTVLEEKGD